MTNESDPIFIWPMARSGGTLFTTILGVHPDLSMSYEIYENDITGSAGAPLCIDDAIGFLEKGGASFQKDCTSLSTIEAENNWIRRLEKIPFRAFVARAHRGGVGPQELLAEMRDYAAEGRQFTTLDDRLDFIDRLMRYKMTKDKKRRWGGKARAPLEVLSARHPQAAVFMMVRDGRDIFASRIRNGSFDPTPEGIAEEWVANLDRFEAFANSHAGPVKLVKYEELVADPERVLMDVCEAIGVAFDPIMVNYEQKDLTLLDRSHGHLSAVRIGEGLNNRTIGQWRQDLSPSAVSTFQEIAGHRLERHGYELA